MGPGAARCTLRALVSSTQGPSYHGDVSARGTITMRCCAGASLHSFQAAVGPLLLACHPCAAALLGEVLATSVRPGSWLMPSRPSPRGLVPAKLLPSFCLRLRLGLRLGLKLRPCDKRTQLTAADCVSCVAICAHKHGQLRHGGMTSLVRGHGRAQRGWCGVVDGGSEMAEVGA